jgi:CheY-like chemotaxis protein
LTAAPADPGAETSNIVISIVDTGPGISPQAQARLFEDYARVHDRPSEVEGTGLGLAISRRLVELMDGKIGVESELGHGSRFWFEVSLPSSAAIEPRRPQTDLAGKRVLVVSPKANLRLMLLQQMRNWGLRVSAASDSDSAEATLRTALGDGEPFDVMVSDLNPLRLGSGLLEVLGVGEPDVLPVATLAAVGDRERPAAARQRGFVVPLAKPLRQNRLLTFLEDAAKGLSFAAHVADDPHEEPFGEVAPIQNAIEEVAGPAAVSSPKANPEPTGGGSAVPSSNQPHRVLVVDDNPVNRRVAQLMLEKAGYVIEEAEDGQVAVDAVTSNGPFDVVLMDVNMPRLDGFQATDAIRQAEGDKRRTPIIAMTASAMSGDSDRCIEAGMDDYVSKPVRAENLLSKVEEWCAKARARGSAKGVPSLYAEDGDHISNVTLDRASLDEMRTYADDDADELIADLAETFFMAAAERLQGMREGFAAGDAKVIADSAHGLKGSAGTLGAPRLYDLCRLLELHGREVGLPADDSLIDEIERELEAVRAAIQQELGEAKV